MDSLNQHQLAYIGDTSFQLSYISWMPHHLREMIDQLSETDYVAREQCLDYLYDCNQPLKMRNKETNRDWAEIFGNKWDGYR